jgi:hypothetical protein
LRESGPATKPRESSFLLAPRRGNDSGPHCGDLHRSTPGALRILLVVRWPRADGAAAAQPLLDWRIGRGNIAQQQPSPRGKFSEASKVTPAITETDGITPSMGWTYPSNPDLFRWSRSVVGPALSNDLLESAGSYFSFYRLTSLNGLICEGRWTDRGPHVWPRRSRGRSATSITIHRGRTIERPPTRAVQAEQALRYSKRHHFSGASAESVDAATD